MFGYIGGIYGLLKTIGSVIFNLVIQKIFYASIVSELYHIEDNKATINRKSRNYNSTNKENSNKIFIKYP